MDAFKQIYAAQAFEYHRMIDREDVEHHLIDALEAICPIRGRRMVDIGSGTGRIPLLFDGIAGQMIAMDIAPDMLRQNATQREKAGGTWDLVQADNRRLPLPDGWAEVVTAGWAIGHSCGWYPQTWREEIARAVGEMERVACRGGTVIIMETLSTGALEPAPPNADLAAYYRMLEQECGFRRDTISTDYQFGSVDEAVAYTEFFFGQELADKIRANGWARLPEWTGIWSKTVKK